MARLALARPCSAPREHINLAVPVGLFFLASEISTPLFDGQVLVFFIPDPSDHQGIG
jgi:hypothetical protein